MKISKPLQITIYALFLALLAIMISGCATTKEVVSLQEKTDLALQKANQALDEAEQAKTMANAAADSAERAATRAESAADRAERAANRAEESARKAEAIFMKTMKKK